MKGLIKYKLEYILVKKAIFNRERLSNLHAHLRIYQNNDWAIHVKVRSNQVLETTLVVYKIIKLVKFKQRYNITLYFLPQYEFRQNARI